MGAVSSVKCQSNDSQDTLWYKDWLDSLNTATFEDLHEDASKTVYQSMECRLEEVRWHDCNLVNVLFYRCRVRNVDFHNIKLKNVCIIGVDCSDVSLSDLDVANQFMTNGSDSVTFTDIKLFKTSTYYKHKTSIYYKLWSLEKDFKIPRDALGAPIHVHDGNKDESPISDAYRSHALSKMGPWQKRGDGCDFLAGLANYPKIMKRILELLITSTDDPAFIYEYGPDDIRTVRSKRECWYKPFCKLFPTHPRGLDWAQGYATTYFGSMRALTHAFQYQGRQSRALEPVHGSVQQVVKGVNALARPLLYNRHFTFQCTHSAIREFLRNHRSGCPLKSLTMDFPSLADNNDIWRDIMKHIRHEHSSLQRITLHVASFFWKEVDWFMNVYEMVKPIDRLDPDIDYFEEQKKEMSKKRWAKLREPHHFLRELAMIAAPARRERGGFWGDCYAPSYDGTIIEVIIAGADEPSKGKFVDRLNAALRKAGRDRPRDVWRAGERLTYRP